MTMTAQFAEVEEWVGRFRRRLAEERLELEESQERALRLTGALLHEEGPGVVPGHLSSLFPEEPPEAFFPFRGDGGRRKRLAQERKNEYNVFLRRKEESEFQRREVPPPAPLARSILESVDYEKILAKRKAEEAEFRNLNRAEPPPVDKSASTSSSSVKKYTHEETERVSPKAMELPPPPPKRNSPPIKVHLENTNQLENSEKKTSHAVTGLSGGERRGGGGDPLRDSSGNLITTRGFVTFPSEQQNISKSKQVSYREELRRQIEEKRLLEEERRRRIRELEEQEERRSEEQRLRMQREYKEEQARTQRKSEQRDRDRLRQLEEFRMREAALRQKRPPPVDERAEPEVVKEAEVGRRSPPIPAVRSKVILQPPLLAEVKPENVFSSISEIRRSLMQEQPRSAFKNSYEVMNRRTVLEDEEEFE